METEPTPSGEVFVAATRALAHVEERKTTPDALIVGDEELTVTSMDLDKLKRVAAKINAAIVDAFNDGLCK